MPLFNILGEIGLFFFSFSNNNLPERVAHLRKCCLDSYYMNKVDFMPNFEPGNCPMTWGNQIYDPRFGFEDSEVKLLRTDGSKRLFRVCFRHRFSHIHKHNNHPDPYYSSRYLSRCCWRITLTVPGSSLELWPQTSNWKEWIGFGNLYKIYLHILVN